MNKIIVLLPNKSKVPAGGESSLIELIELLNYNNIQCLRIPFGKLGLISLISITIKIFFSCRGNGNKYYYFIPEVFIPYFNNRLERINFSIVCLNHRYILKNWKEGTDDSEKLKKYEIANTIICHPEDCFKYLKILFPNNKIIQYFFDGKYKEIGNFNIIENRKKIINRISKNKNLKIAYMPRKRTYEITTLVEELKALSIKYNLPIEFIRIDGNSWVNTMKELKEADILLCSSYLEGYGRPPLEALSQGLILCGFDGGICGKYDEIIYAKNSENVLDYFYLFKEILKNPNNYIQECEIKNFKNILLINKNKNNESTQEINDNIVFGESLKFIDFLYFIHSRYIVKLLKLL